MIETFTWSPLIEPQGTGKFRTRTAQFGDGYKQQVADGLNAESQTWPLTFRGSAAYVAPILAFLRARQGYQSFYWTPPLGQQALFTCSEYGITPHGAERYTLTATFEQSFQP